MLWLAPCNPLGRFVLTHFAQNDKNSIRGNSQTKMAFKAMGCHAKFAYALFARNDDLTRFISSNQYKKKAYLAYSATLYQNVAIIAQQRR